MKYWYDTEFIDDGRTIDLVSIGIVAQDGREFYAVSNDFDLTKLCAHPWLLQNVAPSLPLLQCRPGCRCGNGWHLDVDHPDVRSRGQIARGVREFLLTDGEPVLWSWYPAYDHVALAQLWGPMNGMPKGIPFRTNCIQQEAVRLGIGDEVNALARQATAQHNALGDARTHRALSEYVTHTESTQATA